MIAPSNQSVKPWDWPLVERPAALRAWRRRILEVGPGRGDFLLHLAVQHPDDHVIAIEYRWKRFLKLLRRCRRYDNVTLILGDAARALPILTRQGHFDTLFINFPDPWPKARHAKYRLMQPAFVALCTQALAPAGEFYFTTDVDWYAHQVATTITSHDDVVQSTYNIPIVTDAGEAFPSLFAEKWRGQGRTIYHQRYRKHDSFAPRAITGREPC